MAHMLSNKTSLNKIRKVKILWSIFYDHNGMELAVNYKKKTETHKHVEAK